jgi:hypothetical protein
LRPRGSQKGAVLPWGQKQGNVFGKGDKYRKRILNPPLHTQKNMKEAMMPCPKYTTQAGQKVQYSK